MCVAENIVIMFLHVNNKILLKKISSQNPFCSEQFLFEDNLAYRNKNYTMLNKIPKKNIILS